MTSHAIRTATPDDLPQIVDMIEGIARFTNTLDHFETTVERLQKSLFSDTPVAYALVAEEPQNKALIGYAIYFYNFSSFLGQAGLYLEDLFVQEDYRNQGYGKALFLNLVKIAQQKGCRRLDWLALSWNKPALEFYQKLGATVDPDLRLVRLDGKNLSSLTA